MDTRPSPHSTPLTRDTEAFLYGNDPLPGIVAVEHVGGRGVRLYRREDGETLPEEDEFRPWLLAEHAEPWQALRARPTIESLAGSHALRYLVEFPDWWSFQDATREAQNRGERFFRLRSPVEQYLVHSGRTLFKGMVFGDLRRLQLDIETTGFSAHDPQSQVIAVAIRCEGQVEEVLALEGKSKVEL